jgi:hypothetical protein
LEDETIKHQLGKLGKKTADVVHLLNQRAAHQINQRWHNHLKPKVQKLPDDDDVQPTAARDNPDVHPIKVTAFLHILITHAGTKKQACHIALTDI